MATIPYNPMAAFQPVTDTNATNNAPPASPAPPYNPMQGYTGDAASPATDPASPPPPGLLSSAWRTILGVGPELWHLGVGLNDWANQKDPPAVRAGIVRGVQDVTDKTIEYQNPEYGYTPSDTDLAQVRQQNTAGRAAFDKQYGGNPSANAGRVFGNTVATAPVTIPLGMATGGAADAIGVTALRGVPGVAARAVERAVTGATGGGTQAALTSDPSKPLLPQVGSGALVGGLLSPTVGAVGDVGSNIVRRNTGLTVPMDPNNPGQVSPKTIEYATQGNDLLNAGVDVPVRMLTPDPLVQNSAAIDRAIPGSHIPAEDQKVGGQFSRAAIREVLGPNTDDQLATFGPRPDTFDERARTRVNDLYNNSVRAVPSVPNLGLDTDLQAVRNNVSPGLTGEQQAQIGRVIDHINQAYTQGGGAVTGSVYQDLANRTSGVIAPLLDDPATRIYGRQIYDAMDQRLRSQMSNDQSTMYDQANNANRAWRTIQAARNSDGSFDPKALYTETQKATDRYNSPGTLDGLAQAGNTVLQPSLDTGRSGLAPRMAKAAPGAGGVMTTAGLVGAIQKLLLPASLGDISGTSLATGAAVLGANRALVRAGSTRGPQVVQTALSGGGPSVADLQAALAALRMPVVGATAQQTSQQQ